MTLRPVEVALPAQCDLGEGPCWDDHRRELLWVDIFAGAVRRWEPATDRELGFELGQPVGMVSPRQQGGLVCTVRDGVVFVDHDGANMQLVREVERENLNNRMNDGKCDPQGRLWAGTMALDLTEHRGSLYRIDPDLSMECVRTRVSVSNGLDWSPDGRAFYYIDSATKTVDVYDFDPERGTIRNRQVLIEFSDPVATPDGLTVDAEGTLWIAMWDGGCIRRVTPKGRLIESVSLPVTRPTSVTFGGSGLQQLFITSARHGLNPSQLAGEPHAGDIFAIIPGVNGLPANRFSG